MRFIVCALSSLLLYAGIAKADTLDLKTVSGATQERLKTKFPEAFSKDTFRFAHLDEIIQHLILEEAFDYAEFTQASVSTYKLNVGKNRRIAKVIFKGHSNFSEGQIRREFSVNEKGRFDQDALIDGAERIQKLYDDNGFSRTTVELKFFKVSEAEVEVHVNVNEGPQLRIAEIELRTANEDLKQKLEKVLRRYLKQAYTEKTISELRQAARQFFNQNQYYRADLSNILSRPNAENTQASLIINIENPIRYFITLSGYRRETRSRLDEAMDLKNFFSANPSIGPELANKLKQYYLSQGYARVETSASEKLAPRPYEMELELKVEEGPRVRISSIQFMGSLSLESDEYSKSLQKFASPLLKNNFYNREDLDLALRNFVIDRQNQGYLKSKVNSVRTTYNNPRDQIQIVVNFDEGPLTILENLDFRGNQSFSKEQLQNIVNLTPDQPLKLNLLEESLQKIRNFYRDSGHLEMKLLNEKTDLIIYNEDNTRAQVNYEISEGPKVVVASILVDGNSLTKDYVVRKELEFSEGEILTPQKLTESIARLQRLGHFSTVDIRTLEENTSIANRTVVVRVSERDPGLVNFGIGVNNERKLTLRGFAGIAYRNIFGTGRGVSARLEGNYNVADIRYLERQITLGYLEPYLFDTRIRGRINYTQATSVANFERREARAIDQMNYLLEQDLTSNILLIYELWGLATVRDFPIDVDNTAVQTQELNIGTTGPTLEIDYRDHPFIPTRGSFTRLNLEYGTPALGSSKTIEYVRSIGSYTHYNPLGDGGWVWANSVRAGYLQNLNTRDDGGVPYDKKGLILGGQSTVRGFTLSEAFPNAFELGTDKYNLTTDAQMYLIKSELRFPFKFSSNLGGAFFYDGGAVMIRGVDIKDPYRDSVGIALRYTTPVGAVSLEWGYKLDRKADRGESQWPFHFSIGTF